MRLCLFTRQSDLFMSNFFTTALPPEIQSADDLNLSHFDYELPQALIAQMPARERTASRLLVVEPSGLRDAHFADVLAQFKSGDVLVLNNTKVIKARLFGQKATGGKVEVMVERVSGTHECVAQIRASKTPQPDTVIRVADDAELTVVSKEGRFYHLRSEQPILPMLEQYGHLPLPPYIDHAADDFDAQRYQTVFAQRDGAVAAPTAGLHFDEKLLQKVQEKDVQIAYVTLHVGAGTFLPVSSENLSEHVMHEEWYEIPQATADAINQARAQGRRVVSVGTTSLRALESAYAQQNPERKTDWQMQAATAETRLFIRPPYQFGVVDALITNFHLPQSTLLMLVSAFSGVPTIRDAYNHAISHQYRFFSYGDAMWLDKNN